MVFSSGSIHLFKGLHRLVPSEFESKLYRSNKKLNFLSQDGWSRETKENGLFIDLSQVRWAEMSAVGQLVLLIESAKSSSIHVTVAFPLSNLRTKEKEHLRKLESSDRNEFNAKRSLFHNLKNLRIKTLDYLKAINFESVISCDHIKIGAITKVFDYNDDSESATRVNQAKNIRVDSNPSTDTEYETNYDYKLIIPLTWINSKNQTQNLKNFNELFNRIISQPRRGLDSVDAQAINNVIISELTKNVSEHSDREFGLIGAILQPTSALTRLMSDGCLSFSDFNPVEQDYIEWTTFNNKYYVAIFFGDSGNGIVKKLEDAYKNHANKSLAKPEEVLKWSFDKWSTCKPELETRGTKGLYRIHRIVNKYSGMIMIRTKNILGGFQRGGMDAPTWVLDDAGEKSKELSFIPGTILKMHFTPYKELLKINTHQSKRKNKQSPGFEWVSKSINLVHESPKETFTGDLSLEKIFSSEKTNLLLIINVPRTQKKSGTTIDDIIIDYLKFLSLGRHPNGVLIYIVHEDWDILEAKLDSLNQLIFDHKIKPNTESSHPDKEDVYDPILVLGERGQYTWVGDNRNTISVLNELYEEKTGRKKLGELDSFSGLDSDEQTKIFQFVSNDNAIISLTDGQELRINFGDVVSSYSISLKEKIEQFKSSEDDRKIYLTPNLRYIKKWIDFNEIIGSDTAGFAFALFLAYSRTISDSQKSESRLKILIDSSDDKELANQFALLAGVQSDDVINIVDEIDGRLPRRNPIFEENEDVIILTTIISTAETIRRSIKSIQRDLANPVVVLGLVNQSDVDEIITTWGKDVPIITLLKDSIETISPEKVLEFKKNDSIEYIPPFTFKQNSTNVHEDGKKTNNEILTLIESSKSLHFNHLGKANGRHFTFYLSPNMLLSNEAKFNELIVDKFQLVIDKWLDENLINDFEIWRPALDFKFNDPLEKISDSLSKNYQKKFGAPPKRISKIKRSSLYGEWALTDDIPYSSNGSNNLVILDWGTLTGSTIQQMINLAIKHEKDNILVCVLFSQISKQDSLFYRNINQVAVLKTKNDGTLFPTKELKSASISVNFIYQFLLKYYESFNCPVCEHIKALTDYEIKGQHMGDFSVKRRKRLKIKDKSIADGNLPPQDFYSDYSDDLSELDSALIMKMFKLRILLQEAIESTQKRNEVYEYLESVLDIIATEKTKTNSDLYAILYFLSIEIMWLQKPPLVFKKLRKIISEIAFEIATWDSEEMEKHFNFDTKMVVRYKFSAVSVLRSSDKLLFCANIYQIFIKSKKEENYSHNITQNLFYHTHSLLLKKYHKSTKYFTKTIEDLEKIITTANVSTKIIYVAQYLRNLAEKKKYLISLEGKSNVELIKGLKKEIAEYYGITDHSEIFENFRRMGIENVEEPIKRLDLDSPDYDTNLSKINDWAKGLRSKWGRVSGYIESVVHNHLSKLFVLYHSKLFKHFRIQEYFSVDDNSNFIGYDDDFTTIINHLSNHPADAKLYFESFKANYQRLNVGLFSSKMFNEESDSKLIALLNELPSDVNSGIEHCIRNFQERFSNPPKITFTPINQVFVFYPREEFSFAINQILGNVEKHKSSNGDISRCEILITVENQTDEKSEMEFVVVTITNTMTMGGTRNKIGALTLIKNEMLLFGGECTWNFDTEKMITLKFLNYGE